MTGELAWQVKRPNKSIILRFGGVEMAREFSFFPGSPLSVVSRVHLFVA
jgi:hypothetical protein